MADRISLSAKPRTVVGRKVKTLRRAGSIPGNVYGRGLQSTAVAVDGHAFRAVFDSAGETGVVDLVIGNEKPRPVLVQNVQVHPVSGHALHVDFYQVDLTKTVRVHVRIEIVGESPSVLAKEGLLEQPATELEIEALPTDLPESIHVDVSGLVAVNDTLHVKDLSIPNGVTVLSDKDEVVVKIGPLVTAEMQKAIEVEESATAAAAAAATTT
ncbi:MAG: 50S ribosomal protein L25, partial [bacterium]|nr:50S ribosomal protein L25 [bacterium]